MMADREKVINGLECCLAVTKCGMCPYNDGNDLWCGNNNPLLEDALALLKALEPQVIPADEIRQIIGMPAWVETRSKRVFTGWALVYDIQTGQGITGERMGITQPNGRVSWFLKTMDYGKTWRLWTDKPSSEQREETPWI